MPPLQFHGKLPPGALVDGNFGPVTHQTLATSPALQAPPAPLWFSTRAPESLEFNAEGRVTRWQSTPPGLAATPVSFNSAGTGWATSPPALDFTGRQHGGLCVEAALPQGSCFSLALIYAQSEKRDALTLLSLQAKGDENYIFLNAEAGSLRLAVKGGEASLSTQDPKKLSLLVLSSDGESLKLAVNRAEAQPMACALSDAPLDLFLGCRGASRSLIGKLGHFSLSDLLIWPGLDVLAGSFARAPQPALTLWQERQRDAANL
jgi:hypothetical protein